MTLTISRRKRTVALLAVGLIAIFAGLAWRMTTVAHAANCPTPIGVANQPPGDAEPTVPFFCVDQSTLLAPPTTGSADAFGGYTDPFGETLSGAAHLNNGEAGYQIDAVASGGGSQAQHAITQGGYFVGDFAKLTSEQGTALTPNRSFTFQNGKLVIEADVAAGSFGFSASNGDDIAWPEVDWSTVESPTNTIEGLYGFGYYGGHTSAGCRLQAAHRLTCSLEDPNNNRPLAGETQDQAPCFPAAPARIFELSGFESCGPVHSGFADDSGSSPLGVFRSCPQNTVDPCLDRFRFEWSQNGLVVYINGKKYAEDSGWDANHQIPAAIANGSTPVFVHFFDFSDFSDSNVIRVHWQRIAVNPHDANGNILPPSASPTFGQQPPPPTPTPTPTATPPPPPPGIAFRSSSTVTNGSTVAAPAGLKAGDVELANLEVDADPVSVTAPAGWTLVQDNQATGLLHQLTFAHTAGASEPASYTFTPSVAGAYEDVNLLDYSGATTGVVAMGGAAATTGSSISAPALTAAAGEEAVAFYTSNNFCSWATPSGMTQRTSFDANAGYDKAVTAAGSVGPFSSSGSGCGNGIAATSVLVK